MSEPDLINWHEAEEWCATCGAKIRTLDREKHSDWHAEQRESWMPGVMRRALKDGTE